MYCCRAGFDDGEDIESFYPTRPECRNDVPATRFKPKRGKTLSSRRWEASFSEQGHLDMAAVLRRVQRGGVHPVVKGLVWEFLLGCYSPTSSFDERNQLRQSRRAEYEMLKSKCREMEKAVGSGKIITAPVITDDGQPVVGPSENGGGAENHVEGEQTANHVVDSETIRWKLTLHQIGLDVVRTDRTLAYYESERNRARLWDILAVYSWIDGEIGYCQGMSDLCSPISILVENEADAFWCFKRLMRRLRSNFQSSASSIGVRSQLTVLSSVVKTVDPKLHQHLEELDGGEYLFAFRMLMVLFRREFSFVDTMYLWELMWSMEYDPNIFYSYEQKAAAAKKAAVAGNSSPKEYGKFVRSNMAAGSKDKQTPLSIFLVAGVLESKNKKLVSEAKGLDDVVKILNEITGSLDAKKACYEALKLHQKYLSIAST